MVIGPQQLPGGVFKIQLPFRVPFQEIQEFRSFHGFGYWIQLLFLFLCGSICGNQQGFAGDLPGI